MRDYSRTYDLGNGLEIVEYRNHLTANIRTDDKCSRSIGISKPIPQTTVCTVVFNRDESLYYVKEFAFDVAAWVGSKKVDASTVGADCYFEHEGQPRYHRAYKPFAFWDVKSAGEQSLPWDHELVRDYRVLYSTAMTEKLREFDSTIAPWTLRKILDRLVPWNEPQEERYVMTMEGVTKVGEV